MHENLWITAQIQFHRAGKKRYRKTFCMVEDGPTCEAMQLYIHSAGKNANAPDLASAVIKFWVESGLPEYRNQGLANHTAVRWFCAMGYSWKDLRKGVYKDGHEHPDVITYHQKVFLPKLAELEPLFIQFQLVPATASTPEYVISRPPSALPSGCPPQVPVTHDECSFNSTDGPHQGWVLLELLLAAPAWRANGSDTAATAAAATLWGVMPWQQQWQGDPGKDSLALFHSSVFRILPSILLHTLTLQ